MSVRANKIAVVAGGCSGMNVPVIVIDGVTKLPSKANGGVVLGGSNATAYAAYLSAKGGARAAILASEVCLGGPTGHGHGARCG